MVWMRNYTAQWMSCTAICEILLEYQLLAITYPPQVPIASNHYVYHCLYVYCIYIYIIHHFFWVWSIFNRIWSHVATPWLFALATKACFIPAFLWRPGAAETWVPRVPRGEEIHPGTAGDGHYNSAKISILPGCLGRGCLLENPRTQWRF